MNLFWISCFLCLSLIKSLKEHNNTSVSPLACDFPLWAWFGLRTLNHVCVLKVRYAGQVTLVYLRTGSPLARLPPQSYSTFTLYGFNCTISVFVPSFSFPPSANNFGNYYIRLILRFYRFHSIWIQVQKISQSREQNNVQLLPVCGSSSFKNPYKWGLTVRIIPHTFAFSIKRILLKWTP